jgi:HD-like signal output (HDOD) protein
MSSAQSVWEMEKEYFGYTHAELGGCMLGTWGLALPVVEAVAWHHHPEPDLETQPTPRALVYEANRRVRAAQSTAQKPVNARRPHLAA